jgi:[ribosomal protein S18]-alanine N-acetyltransferase
MPNTLTETGQTIHTRWCIRRDMPEILDIEKASFPEPWSEASFLAHLKQNNCISRVAEIGERIAGFSVYFLMERSIEIANLAVHPDFRHQGVARTIVAELIDRLANHRRKKLLVVVKESNLAAQLFFRRMRFVCMGIMRSPFADSEESGYRMEYVI